MKWNIYLVPNAWKSSSKQNRSIFGAFKIPGLILFRNFWKISRTRLFDLIFFLFISISLLSFSIFSWESFSLSTTFNSSCLLPSAVSQTLMTFSNWIRCNYVGWMFTLSPWTWFSILLNNWTCAKGWPSWNSSTSLRIIVTWSFPAEPAAIWILGVMMQEGENGKVGASSSKI